MSNEAQTLVLVLDTCKTAWESSSSSVGVFDEKILESVFMFLNAFTILNSQNKCVVLANCSDGSAREVCKWPLTFDDSKFKKTPKLKEYLQPKLQEVIEKYSNTPRKRCGVGAALCMGACILRKSAAKDSSIVSSRETDGTYGRMLFIHASSESSKEYTSATKTAPFAPMNGTFALQKLKIPVDVCWCSGYRSLHLFKTTTLTGGLFVDLPRLQSKHPDKSLSLSQQLLTSFLPGLRTKSCIRCGPEGVSRLDLRARCFCHAKLVSVGFVCSTCLGVYCEYTPVCPTCRTKVSSEGHQKRARR